MAAANPRWEAAQDEVLELKADVDPALSVSASIEASLSTLHTTWTQGPYAPDERGVVTVRIDVPSEAFLDEAALDYLTILRVRLAVSDETHVRYELRAPNGFVAWPDGREADAVVWDEASARTHAPNGVVSSTVRASLGESVGTHWVAATLTSER